MAATEDGPFRPAFLRPQEEEPRELLTSAAAADPEAGLVQDAKGDLVLRLQRTVVGLCCLIALNAIAMCEYTAQPLIDDYFFRELHGDSPKYVEVALAGRTESQRLVFSPTYAPPVFLALGLGGLGLAVAALFLLCPCTTCSLSTRSGRSRALCLVVLVAAALLIQQSVSLSADAEGSAAQLLEFVKRCSPEVCRDLPGPEWQRYRYPGYPVSHNRRHGESLGLEWVDCMARGQYGPEYKPAFAGNRERWSDSCPPIEILSCRHDAENCHHSLSNQQLRWGKYSASNSTDQQCPCDTAEINDLSECKLAFETLKQQPQAQGSESSNPGKNSGDVEWIEPKEAWEGLSGCQISLRPGGKSMTFNPNPCKIPDRLAEPVCVTADEVTREITRKQREERCKIPHVSQLAKSCRAKSSHFNYAVRHLDAVLTDLSFARNMHGVLLVPLAAMLAALLWHGCSSCCRCSVPCKGGAWQVCRIFSHMRAWFRVQAWLVQQHMQERETAQAGDHLQLRTLTEPLDAEAPQEEG